MAQIVRELEERRTRNYSIFLRDDGLKVYRGKKNMNFLSGGKLVPTEGNFALANNSGEFSTNSDSVRLSIAGDSLSVRMPKVGQTTLKLLGMYVDNRLIQKPKDVTPVAIGNTLWYLDVFENIDIEIVVSPTGFRRYIHIKDNPLKGLPYDGESLSFRFLKTGPQIPLRRPEALALGGPTPTVVLDQTRTMLVKSIPIARLYDLTYPLRIDDSYQEDGNGNDANYKYDSQGSTYTQNSTTSTIQIGKSDRTDGKNTYYSFLNGAVQFDLTGFDSSLEVTQDSLYISLWFSSVDIDIYAGIAGQDNDFDPESIAASTGYTYCRLNVPIIRRKQISPASTVSLERFQLNNSDLIETGVELAADAGGEKVTFCFEAATGAYDQFTSFYSTDYATAARHPELEFTYSGDGGGSESSWYYQMQQRAVASCGLT